MSRRAHSSANSGLRSAASATIARKPSSPGHSAQAARNWATTRGSLFDGVRTVIAVAAGLLVVAAGVVGAGLRRA